MVYRTFVQHVGLLVRYTGNKLLPPFLNIRRFGSSISLIFRNGGSTWEKELFHNAAE